MTIAADLFSRQGYYHCPSKADILGGPPTEPLTAYNRIIESLDRRAGRDHWKSHGGPSRPLCCSAC